MCDTTTYPSGVDGESGELLRAPGLDEITKLFLDNLPPLRPTRRDLPDGISPWNLDETGWGILFAQADERAAEIRERLLPLLNLRKEQARNRYREYLGEDGYHAGEDRLEFLAHHRIDAGKVDPERVPFYLLLVGSPEQIPYEFQYGMDIQYAVGRICFETLEEYASYAESVVAAEMANRQPRRKVAFFGPLQDEGTQLSQEGLLNPLIESVREMTDCQVSKLLGDDATKTALLEFLSSPERSDILFTAGHGVFFRSGHERQRSHQGALVCQGWPGHGHPPEPDHVLAGQDLNGGVRLKGLLAFLFACNSAGTPDLGDFAPEDGELRQAAPHPFVSSLAQRLLGHPDGGALAVVGHVERVWRCSFVWRDTGYQPRPFIEMLHRLLDGAPLGWALDSLNQRYADLSAGLTELLAKHYQGFSVNARALADLWTASRDARNYVVVGDPAVRLFGTPEPDAPRKRVTRG